MNQNNTIYSGRRVLSSWQKNLTAKAASYCKKFFSSQFYEIFFKDGVNKIKECFWWQMRLHYWHGFYRTDMAEMMQHATRNCAANERKTEW
jgi:hypothetical protein